MAPTFVDPSRQQAKNLATILDLSRLVCSSLELNVVFEHILRAVGELSGADIVSIMLVDEQGEFLRFMAAYGLPLEQTSTPSFRLGEGVAGWVAQHGVAVHTASLRSDPRFVPIYTSGDATLFALPLQVRDRTLGVLNLARSNGGELFSPETVQMVEIFASHAAIAIDNAAAATTLRFAATRERVARLVHQAPREPGAASAVIGEILSTMAEILELAAAGVFGPDGQGGYEPIGACPMSGTLLEPWRPARDGGAMAEQRDGGGSRLEVALRAGDAHPCWLVLMSRHPTHYWRRDERELARFAADQIALLLANEHLLIQEQQSSALSQTLSQLAAACNAMVGHESLLDFILDQLARSIDYDSSAVFLFNDDQYARLVAGRGFRDERPGIVIYMGPGSVSWLVRQERRAIYLPDVLQIGLWRVLKETERIRAWIGTPLIVNGAVIGMLTIDKWQPDAFSERDVRVAQLFADHVAVAVNNQMLLHDAQNRASQLQLLHQLGLRMSAFREPDALLGEVARLLQTTCDYDQVCVVLAQGERLALRAAYGALSPAEAAALLVASGPDYGLTGRAVRSGETVLVNNIAQEERLAPRPGPRRAAAALVAPIMQQSQVLGAIAVESNQTGAFSQHDVYLVEAIAGQTALALTQLRHNEELRRTEERLAQSERLRALGELASGVAHDFNNLLASILGHTQLLLGEPLEPRLASELRVIERATLDGAASVRRLQGFAQTSRALPSTTVDLGEIIAESLAITRPRWRDGPQSQGVAIVVQREPGLVPPFAGDAPALRDMIANLVLNAVDAMPQGGRLLLRTTALAAEVSPLGLASALLEVSDTGVGIAPETQARIFDPFFSTKGPQGTGLGLTMVYGVVQRHQGQISVASVPGRGTTFSVYLPIRSVPAGPGAPNGRAATPAASAEPPPSRQVLVVDDDEAVRRVLVRQISRLGHRVAEAGDGETALALLATNRFDLICTDLGMPGMSGWELIARARQLNGELQTVLVTGWGEQIDPETARSQGADAVIAKPFDLVRLKEVLAELPGLRLQ